MAFEIPEVVIFRIPVYLYILNLLDEEKVEVVSSQEIGARLQMTPAQIRKDLSYFGKFGKQGKGYNVKLLMNQLREIMGLDREWNMALIGVGRLGKAILDYSRITLKSFKYVAAFDIDPNLIGKKAGGLVIQDMPELAETVKGKNIAICVLAVPPSQVQQSVDRLVECGVKAILNYAPVATRAPKDVRIRKVDPQAALQTMAYHLQSLGPS
jgi:redox-sensing transcriptional repressor